MELETATIIIIILDSQMLTELRVYMQLSCSSPDMLRACVHVVLLAVVWEGWH